MITDFGDRGTERLYNVGKAAGFPPTIVRVAVRKLAMLDAAHTLDDLKSPPGNRLEALKGRGEGYFSIRVNDQWRIVFRWAPGRASKVSIVDYH